MTNEERPDESERHIDAAPPAADATLAADQTTVVISIASPPPHNLSISTPTSSTADSKKRTAEEAFGSENNTAASSSGSEAPSTSGETSSAQSSQQAAAACPSPKPAKISKPSPSFTTRKCTIESKSSPNLTITKSLMKTSSAPAYLVPNDDQPSSQTSLISSSTLDDDTEGGDDTDAQLAALGALIDNSGKQCSYDQGYIKRQLIYACKTCTLDVMDPAGICLACALNCHEDHDVLPMLTRRAFRCDCGNSRFGPRKCILSPNKESNNPQNSYNTNFHGKICKCHKQLDGNSTEEVELAQCRLCEEQFHGNHIGVLPEEFGDEWDGELACPSCLEKHSFLIYYSRHLANPLPACSGESSGCFLTDLRTRHPEPLSFEKGIVFPAKWWELLCKCEDCMKLYSTHKIEFLIDPEDTYTAYEEREKAKEQENTRRAAEMSPEEIFTQICEGFDPITQMELAHWFTNLRDTFVAFLRAKIEQGRTITDTDIEEFFTSFSSSQEDGPTE